MLRRLRLAALLPPPGPGRALHAHPLVGLLTAVLLVALQASAVAEAPAGEAVVTRKAGYVHVLWDAAEATKGGKSVVRGAILASAARLVAARLTGADPEDVRIDVVVVHAKDGYGKPKWDSLTRVAKLQARKARLVSWASGSPKAEEAPESLFGKVEWF